jgi:two-component system nitrogen regulation sensor histidine kinase GlnL
VAAEAYGASPLAHFDPAELLDAQATGLVVLDAHLCTIYANVGAQDLLGLGLNQVRGRPISELFADAAPLAALLRLALERGEPCAGHELSLLPIAGLQVPRAPVVVDAAVTPLEGQITGRHLLLELTDARLRQRITRENELLSRIDGGRMMARQLAHEIKNPLGGLRGAAQLLERQLKEPALHEYTAVIIAEADRLAALVDALLGPGQPPRKEPVNIHEIVQHVGHLLAAEAPTGVQIERDYDPSLPRLRLDRNQIIQALLNLGRNAIQAVGEHGRIVLRTRALTNASIGSRRYRVVVGIQVEDDGPGVPIELKDTVFYPLVTGRKTGTGLGLAVAQDLIGRHDGLIEFDSRPGRTVFTILLPFDANEPTAGT